MTRESPVSEGLPAPLLHKKLHDAATLIDQAALDLSEGHLDVSTVGALLKTLDMLAYQAVVAQACIISTAAALSTADVRVVERMPASTVSSYVPQAGAQSYLMIRAEALERLGKIGNIFGALTPAFEEFAFPARFGSIDVGEFREPPGPRPGPVVRAWGSRSVDVGTAVSASTGKGYLNTFQDDRTFEPSSRREAFDQRLQRFLDAGGSLSHIIELHPVPLEDSSTKDLSSPQARTASRNMETWHSLAAGQWYDYVVALDHTIRCYPTSLRARKSRPKCGHTVLASTGLSFSDDPIVMAGDLCLLRDFHGNVEVLIITNNSGHFKPSAADLHNAVLAFEKAGIKKTAICLYSGPNSILAMRRDLSVVQDSPSEEPPVPANLAAGEDPLNPYVMVSQWEKQR